MVDPDAKGGTELRQNMLESALDYSVVFLGDVVTWAMRYGEEQANTLDAAGMIEETMPKPNWSPRSLALLEASEDVQQQIDEYQSRVAKTAQEQEAARIAKELDDMTFQAKPATVSFFLDKVGGAVATRLRDEAPSLSRSVTSWGRKTS